MELGTQRVNSYSKQHALLQQKPAATANTTVFTSPFARLAMPQTTSESPGQGMMEGPLPLTSSTELVAQAATVTVAGPARSAMMTSRDTEGENSAYADFKSQSRTFQDVQDMSMGGRTVSLPNLQLQNKRALREGLLALGSTTGAPGLALRPQQRRMSIEERLELHERVINERLMMTDLVLEGMARSDSNRPSVCAALLCEVHSLWGW